MSALCWLVHSIVSLRLFHEILINLSLLTTALKAKTMQGSLTLVLSLSIGENHMPSRRVDVALPCGHGFNVLLLAFFEKMIHMMPPIEWRAYV